MNKGCKVRCKHKTRDGRCPYSKCVNPKQLQLGLAKKFKALKYMKVQEEYSQEIRFQKTLGKEEQVFSSDWLAGIIRRVANDKISEIREQQAIERKRWKEVRVKVLIRDNCRCRECNRRNNLTIHFIDYDIANYQESNLETLCKRCHWKKHLTHAGAPMQHLEESLSEESKRLVDLGLKEAKEGKIE